MDPWVRQRGIYDIESLRGMKAVILGAGGLGSNVATFLARLGVGKLIIIDHDRVEVDNLHRQQYFPEDVGKFKVHALCNKLSYFTECIPIVRKVERVEDLEGLEGDLFFGLTDNIESRIILEEYGVKKGKVVISAMVEPSHGMIVKSKGGPCLRQVMRGGRGRREVDPLMVFYVASATALEAFNDSYDELVILEKDLRVTRIRLKCGDEEPTPS